MVMTVTFGLVAVVASCPAPSLTSFFTSAIWLYLSVCSVTPTILKSTTWKDPDKMLEGACQGGTNNNRTQCRMMYLFITKLDTYRIGMKNCRHYNASIATFKNFAEVEWAAKQPFVFDKKKKLNFFVGAKKFERGFYRWENGLLITSQEDLANVSDHVRYDMDDDSPDQCLTLTDKMKFKVLHCNYPNGVICERCVVPMPPESKCGAFCVFPGGRIECKTYVKDCPVNAFMGRSTTVCSTLPCPHDRWGDKCDKICMCRKGVPCDIRTGKCPEIKGYSGKGLHCEHSWLGKACNESICHPHQWTSTCVQNCSCQHGQACEINSGDCHTGCMPGAYGRYCQKTKCPPGKFGPGCNQNCHCLEIGRLEIGYCSQVHGICLTVPGRCQHGWYGRSCNMTRCPHGYYGSRCLSICNCFYGTCNSTTGQCYGKCRKGWSGQDCGTSRCPLNKWHLPDCQVDCRYQCRGGGCDPVTGECLSERYRKALQKRKDDACKNRATGLDCRGEPCGVANCTKCDRWHRDRCYECSEGNNEVDEWEYICVESCEAGKSGPSCHQTCSCPNCRICMKSDRYHCTKCKPGFTLTLNFTCAQLCPKPGTWGDRCDKVCPVANCYRCNRFIQEECSICLDGYVLNKQKQCDSVEDQYDNYGVTEVVEEINMSPVMFVVAIFPTIWISIIMYNCCQCYSVYDIDVLMHIAHPEQRPKKVHNKKKRARAGSRESTGTALSQHK